jgi:hypothetical protein
VQIFSSTVPWGGHRVNRSAVLLLFECGFGSGRSQVAGVNEFGNVVARGETDLNGMFRADASIVIFEPLSQGMSGNADDGIHLRVKGFRTPKGVHGNAVLLDFVDSSFEIFFANKCQQSNGIVCPPKYTGRQDVVYFSPLGLKFADRPFQALAPESAAPSTSSPRLRGEYNRIFRCTTQGQTPVISPT